MIATAYKAAAILGQLTGVQPDPGAEGADKLRELFAKILTWGLWGAAIVGAASLIAMAASRIGGGNVHAQGSAGKGLGIAAGVAAGLALIIFVVNFAFTFFHWS